MITDVSLMDQDIKNKIRTLYLDGKEVKEIIEILNIPKGTWDNYFYLNKYDFRSFIMELKREKMIQATENISKKILSYNPDDIGDKRLAIVQKEAEFIRETQGKDQGYSKRIETIGLNINKNEPLDDEQKEKLNKLLRTTGNKPIRDTTIIQETETPITTTTQEL